MEEFKLGGLFLSEAVKKTPEKISNIYEEATIKNIDPRKIVQKIHRLVQMKKAEEK